MRSERPIRQRSRSRRLLSSLGVMAMASAIVTPPSAIGGLPSQVTDSVRPAAADRDASAADADRDAPSIAHPLVPGRYASRQAFSTIIKTPPLGRRQTGVTVSFALHDVTVAGDELIASTRFCAVDPIPFGGVKSTMPDAFVAAMPMPLAAVTVEGPEGGPWMVSFEEWTMVIGVELDDPADPLPTEEDDPRVTDPDQDGEPGVTVYLSGMIRGRTYVVQRIVRSMSGVLMPDGSMDGTLEGRAEQETLGASNPLLSKFKPTFLDETEARLNVFQWRPVPPATTCEELLAEKDALFD
jgi:hypothetical protein